MRQDTDATRTDALVERLLRMADGGPDIPGDGAARVKAALRPVWRRAAQQRARRRWLVGAAAAAAVLAAVALGFLHRESAPAIPDSVAQLDVIRGVVEIVTAAGEIRTLADGWPEAAVTSGSIVRTGAASRVALRLKGGQSLRLDLDTSVRLDSPEMVRLDHGGVYVDSAGAESGGVRVETPLGGVREIGTRFEVRHDDGTMLVRVRAGKVAIARGRDEVEIGVGSAIAITPDGRLERTLTAADGAEWRWVQQVAPTFEIEGRTVAAFLDWVSSESGLQVVYQEPEIASFVADTVLHGTAGDLTPDNAAEIVLPSCGLQVMRDGSTLVVGRGRQTPAAR
jgi:ferric-dicitrate binding protein FerR (iron transport regulator)